MYATEYGEPTKKGTFTTGISEFPRAVDTRLPTMDKRLDRYFDQHMESIISEWGLLTTRNLAVFERRLEDVSGEIQKIVEEKSRLEERASAIDDKLREMEGA